MKYIPFYYDKNVEKYSVRSKNGMNLHHTCILFLAGLASPFYVNFRVRFFISDPNSLQHEQTRCVFVLICCVLVLAGG